jgi:hypothetical protein
MRAMLLLVLVFLTGCAKDLTGTEPTSHDTGLAKSKITYLGVGGWLLNWKDEGLLFAPSFSNPGFPPLLVRANPTRIDAHMPPVPDVRVLLIGHAHYDHLLDVPHIMQRQARQATAYGNATVGHTLAAVKPPLRFVNVEPKMVRVHCRTPECYLADPEAQWTRIGHIRFMAIESKHAPHIAGLDLLKGSYYDDLDTLPTYVGNWKEGTTLAFLVDLLDDDLKTPIYRLHYQDSASNPPYGFPPLMPDGKGVDVVIMCGASTDQVVGYPDALLRYLHPRLLLIGHWEDFFDNDLNKPPRLLRGQREGDMLDRISRDFPKLEIFMPHPLTEVALPPLKPKP